MQFSNKRREANVERDREKANKKLAFELTKHMAVPAELSVSVCVSEQSLMLRNYPNFSLFEMTVPNVLVFGNCILCPSMLGFNM